MDGQEIYPDLSQDFVNPPGGFPSRKELQAHVEGLARARNYSLSVRSSRSTGQAGAPYVRFECSAGGKPRNETSRGQSQKTGCLFQVVGFVHANGQWRLEVPSGRGSHNHPCMNYLEGSRYGVITPEELERVKELDSLGVSPSGILTSLKRAAPTNLTSKSQMSNALAKLRRAERQEENEVRAFLKNLRSHKWRIARRKDPITRQIRDAVFYHPHSRAIINTYPQVIFMDCTYKTNKYKKAFLEVVGATCTGKTFIVAYAFMHAERTENFIYVLEYIKLLFQSDEHPKVVVTDRDLALINAVKTVFPNAKHHLCQRHIEQAILAKCIDLKMDPQFAEIFKKKWNDMIRQPTREDFDTERAALARWGRRYPILLPYLDDTWLNPYTENICSHTIDRYVHYGAYTTNR